MLLAAGAATVLASRPSNSGVSFERQVQPIFDAKCVTCHPTSYPYLDLRRGRSYGELVRVSSPLAPAFERVLPRRPELSYLLTHPPEPSNQRLLSPAERQLIARWISEGAEDN